MSKIEIRQILCPTDFSEPSRRALEHAVPLARWYGAKITALHALPLLPPLATAYPVYVDPMTLEPIPRGHLVEQLRAFLAPAEEAAVETDALLVEGGVTRTILDRAAAIGADLIVMGVRGRGALDLALFGSTTNQVVRGANCPVLTVREA